MEKHDQDAPIAVSEDAARAGVTGHHVRFVLAFGLAGIVIAFAAIGIYFGYDRLTESISRALARDPYEVMRDLAPYVVVIILGAVATALLLFAWNRVVGPTENSTQTGMRIRVAVQFVVICAIMTIVYLAAS